MAGGGGEQGGASPRVTLIGIAPQRRRRLVGWEDGPPSRLFSLISLDPATLSLTLSSKAVSQPLASSRRLGAHLSALPLTPFLEGPSRKACRCPPSPGAWDPLRGPPCPPPPPSFEEQLRLALELSSREQEERERRGQQEEEDLQRILRLSLTEH